MSPKAKGVLARFKPMRQLRSSSSYVLNNVKKYEDQDIAGWLPEAREAISRIERLPDGWDSYGSNGVQPLAVKNAIRFLFEAPSRLVPAPHIAATPGGGIGFHWLISGRDLEIEFTPTGTIEFLKSYPGTDREPEEGVMQDVGGSVLRWVAGFV